RVVTAPQAGWWGFSVTPAAADAVRIGLPHHVVVVSDKVTKGRGRADGGEAGSRGRTAQVPGRGEVRHRHGGPSVAVPEPHGEGRPGTQAAGPLRLPQPRGDLQPSGRGPPRGQGPLLPVGAERPAPRGPS